MTRQIFLVNFFPNIHALFLSCLCFHLDFKANDAFWTKAGEKFSVESSVDEQQADQAAVDLKQTKNQKTMYKTKGFICHQSKIRYLARQNID